MTRTFSDWMSEIMGRRVELPVPRSIDELVRARAAIDWSHLNVDLPELAATHLDVELGGPLRADVHVPDGRGPFPTLLFLHGGGWFAGSAANERKLAMQLAAAGHVVVNLDYALAPEAPFPAALDDVLRAARWCRAEIERYDGDPRRLAIGGASAGANLAAAAIGVLHGDDAPVAFRACLLLYGIFDLELWTRRPGAFAGRAELYQAAYLGPDWRERSRDPRVSPIRLGNLARFPATYLSCGALDSVLGQSLAFCEALAEADVPTTLSVVPGADHAFLNLPHARRAVAERRRITHWLSHCT